MVDIFVNVLIHSYPRQLMGYEVIFVVVVAVVVEPTGLYKKIKNVPINFHKIGKKNLKQKQQHKIPRLLAWLAHSLSTTVPSLRPSCHQRPVIKHIHSYIHYTLNI